MTEQLTLSIIKPDATQRNITGQINSMIEDEGYRIITQKKLRLTRCMAEGFYAEHKERAFFQDLVTSMISGPVVIQTLAGHKVIEGYRKLMGATNPKQADEKTIRKCFGKSVEANSVHGSDSPQSAAREIAFFFSQAEILDLSDQ